MRILWIEDREDHVKYHLNSLRDAGFQVRLVGSGEEGMGAITEAWSSGDTAGLVVFLDVMLPKGAGDLIDPMTRPELMGEEILHQMKSKGISIPVVVVTAIADGELRRRLAEDYPFVSQVIKKPVRSPELIKAYHGALTPLSEGKEGTGE